MRRYPTEPLDELTKRSGGLVHDDPHSLETIRDAAVSNANLLHRKIALRQQRQPDTLTAQSIQRGHHTGDERRVGSEHGPGGILNPLPDVISKWAIARRTDGVVRLDT